METSPVTSRRNIRAILALCLLASLLAFGYVLLRDQQPSRISSRDVPLPFGGRETTLRGQVSEIGSTSDNRAIIDMTFDKEEISHDLSVNDLTFVLTPDLPETFSSGAPLSVVFTPNKRFYGYKYTSTGAAIEIARDLEKKMSAQTGQEYLYTYLFPGEFFASPSSLAEQAFVDGFAAKGITFGRLADVTLDADSRYLLIAEEAGVSIRVRGLVWCGDHVTQSAGIDGIADNADDEECDDGIENDNTCTPPSGSACRYCEVRTCRDIVINDQYYCGDGTVDADGADGIPGNADDEFCDDKNATDNDGCTACRIDPGYICNNEQSHPSSCIELCGDGTFDADGADKIPGNADDEACDDGNATDDDGCTACTVDADWTCDAASPTVCQLCGNEKIEGTEKCDDGNEDPGDGCSATCTVEPTWSCTETSPTVCLKCGDGTQQAYGFDGFPGKAGIDDDADDVIDNPEEWLAEGSDDEQCDAGVKNGASTCSTTCRLTVPLPIN